MFDFIFGFLFGALPPEVNSTQLHAAPGPVPLFAAGDAYSACFNALSIAASGSQGSMAQLGQTWNSPAGHATQQAFLTHAGWMQAQADIALHASVQLTLAAAANSEALIAMPPVPAILAVQATTATLIATNAMGVNSATIATTEGIYATMWQQAAMAMTNYAGQAIPAMASLQAPLPAPPIVAGTPAGPAADMIASAWQAGLSALHGGGAGTNAAPGVGQSASGGGTGPVGGGTAGGPGGDGSTSGGGNPGGGNPGGGTSPGSDPAVGQLGIPDAPESDALGHGGAGRDSSLPQDSGFYGTSPTSPTLDALNNIGVGSPVALGMTGGGGGLSALSSTTGGIRMPTNWNPAAAQAFGAGTGNQAGAQPLAQRTAPRGVTAPKAQRRRDKDENRPSKAIAAEAGVVPELEQTGGLGVIEYADTSDAPLTASEQLLVPGVLGTADWDEQS